MPAAAHRHAVRALAPAAQAHRRATIRDLQSGFRTLAPLFANLRTRLVQEYEHAGHAQVLRTFEHWYTRLVVVPRLALYEEAMARAALRRAAILRTELRRRYGGRYQFHDDTVQQAIAHVLRTPRGRRGWSYAQQRIPSDGVVEQRFVAVLTDWVERRQRELARVARLSAHKDDVPKADGVPRIDPDRRRIEYPTGDPSERQLLDEALDGVVVGRGKYFAEVGLRDVVREVDRAVSLIEGGRQPMIIGWRWVLSAAHDEKLCPTGICSALATADVGHPYGPGVYFDALIPSEHPNGWCDVEAEWASEDDLADPAWSPPEPPDDYEDRVRAIYDEHNATLIS